MNILLSCVGRRSYMVEYFQQALQQYGGKVIGTNSEADTTGMFASDVSYVVPAITDPTYIDSLLDICIKEKVKMVVSLFDIDLPYLAAAKPMFEKHGVAVVVSSPDVIDIANDKFKTYQFLTEHNIPAPMTYCDYTQALNDLKSDKLKYPLFIKPRWGMGSIGVYKAENEEEFNFYYKAVQKQIENSYLKKLNSAELDKSVLIQASVEGEEYGIDIFNTLDGDFLISVEKRKLSMRSGETDGAIVIQNEQLSELSHKVSKLLKHIGNLDMDVLYNENTFYVLELNARFGGGYPFSHLAGANFPKLLIDFIEKNPIELPNIHVGTKSLKSIVPIKVN